MVGDHFTGKGLMAGRTWRTTYLQEYLCLSNLPVIILPEHRFSNALACPTQVTLVGQGVIFIRTSLTPCFSQAQWGPFLVSVPAAFC